MTRTARYVTRELSALLLLVVTSPLALAETNFDRGLLWRVEREGLPPSFVFGTVHVTDERVLDVPKPVTGALAQSKTAVFELIVTPELQAELAGAMMFTDGTSLKQLTGEELFATTSDVAATYGLIPSVLNLIKPWALIAMFSAPPEETQRQALGHPMLDAWLQDEARRQNKKLLALEEPHEQIAALEGLELDHQLELLRATVENKADVDRMFANTLDLYLDRDLAGLQQLTQDEMAAGVGSDVLDDFNQNLIISRNDTMAERLLPLMKDGGVFVAVGALHLPGDNGLLNQLADAGYDVTVVY
ncbi:MAG: TraB/GumN family protein [Pseudomonadota bacterium]